MNSLYLFLIRNDVWIYILSVLGIFWYFTELLRARYLLRRAMFGLERERGLQKQNNAALYIVVLTAVILSVIYVNRQIAPTLPPTLFQTPTPTPDIFSTPLSSPTPLSTPISTPTSPLAPTVTLAGDNPAGTILENSANESGNESAPVNTPQANGIVPATATPPPIIDVTPVIGCIPQLNISQPRDGSVPNKNEIVFLGTAAINDFQYYMMEINGPQTNGLWASLLGRNQEQPVSDGFLGQADLGQWESGPYLVRLTAVTRDNAINQCVIQITLN